MRKTIIWVVIIAIVLAAIVAGYNYWGNESSSLPPAANAANRVTYTQEAFLADLLNADGTKLNNNVWQRNASVAASEYGMNPTDPFAGIVGFCHSQGYLPEGFNPKGSATLEAIMLVLDRYSTGWSNLLPEPQAVAAVNAMFPQTAENGAIRLAARNVAMRFGLVSFGNITATTEPSSEYMNVLLGYIK